MICAKEGLAIYDNGLNEIYTKLTKKISNSLLKASQIQWIKYRDLSCGQLNTNDSLALCIAKKTRARTRYLRLLMKNVN